MDQSLKTESLPPLVSVTVSTLQILSKQDNYADVLALYMAYVEITVWQANASIFASKSFMMTRLKWGEDRVINARNTLKSLGLIEDRRRRDEGGQLGKMYTLVKHIITATSPAPPETQRRSEPAQVSEGTSANDLKQLNANDPNIPRKKLTANREELLALVNRYAGRKFRSLPERGAGKLAGLFTMAEIEQALSALASDPWHKERLHELSIEYLLRATTIDKFLKAPAKPKPVLGPPQEIDWSNALEPLPEDQQ